MKFLRILLAGAIAAAPMQAFAASKTDGGRPGAFLDYAASARSLGMGHAFTAIANDPSAIYWNPVLHADGKFLFWFRRLQPAVA